MNCSKILLMKPFIALGILAVSGSAALAVTFGFEGQSVGTVGSVTETSGGLTITVTSSGSALLDVLTPPVRPPSWGNISLTSFFQGGSGLVVNFSSAVNSAGIQFGDYDADDDPVTFLAYSGLGGTGMLLGTDSLLYPASKDISNGDSDVGSVGVSAAGIMSFVVTSGGAFPGSLYWDNVTATTGASVPDSGATFLLIILTAPWLFVFKRLANRRTSQAG